MTIYKSLDQGSTMSTSHDFAVTTTIICGDKWYLLGLCQSNTKPDRFWVAMMDSFAYQLKSTVIDHSHF